MKTVATWDNKTRPNGAGNTIRPLTHLLDSTERQAAVKATRKPCSIDDCTNPAIARGWCTAHWTRWKRHGDPLGGGTPRQPMPDRCTADEDCDNPPFARGLCATHWRRDKATQDPDGYAEFLAKRREWQANNTDRVAASRKKSREKNLEANLARCAAWRGENRDRVMANNWIARRRSHGLPEHVVELVDPAVVYDRDRGICQICGDPVDATLPPSNPWSATIDHRIPVVDPASEHSYANTQLAHFDCNRRKRSATEETA